MKVIVTPNVRGGIRSVIEAYERDGFLSRQNVRIIHSYEEGYAVKRHFIFLFSLLNFVTLALVHRIELVHIHAAMRGSFWRKCIFLRLSYILNIPTILHLHGSEMDLFYNGQIHIVKNLIRSHLQLATRVIVLSRSWANFVFSVAPAARIEILPNYITLPPENPDVRSRKLTVLFLGLVGPRKGTFDLILAFKTVVKKYPETRLIIAGNGQTDIARELINKLGLSSNIELAGWVDGQHKKNILSTCNIFVLPSYHEGLPVSILEAMAAGAAVITTPVGGIPELITNGENGILINPGDIDALASQIATLMSDPERCRQIAAAGRERVAKSYSDSAVLPLLEAVYDQCRRSAD